MSKIKSFDPEKKIRLYKGTIKQTKNIQIGDKLVGLDGKPKKIVDIEHGHGQMYQVSQKLGYDYIVSKNHILVLKLTNVEGIFWDGIRNRYKARYIQDMRIHDKCFQHLTGKFTNKIKMDLYEQAKNFLTEIRKEDGYNRIGDVIEISVKDYLKLPANMKRILYGFKQSVEYPEKNVEIDPYMLGLWLGDGTSEAPIVTNIDQPIIDYLYNYAKNNNLRITKRQEYGYSIAGNYKKNNNILRNGLNYYNLLNNKHIPSDYLINSRDVRLKVLAGIIDTDGYLDHNMYEITQKSNILSLHIKRLCESLGFRISTRKVIKYCHKPDGTKVPGVYNRMLISGKELGQIPVLLDRKKANPIKDVDFLITMIKVEEIDVSDYVSFKLEADENFLGTDYTVL
jgi:hypothetical protein